jgi:tRNA pseudouridine13 synthase
MKATPEDFRVAEISSYPLPDPAGSFTVLRVVSRDWEQHELGAALARELGLPPHAIAWSGTKDRRAVADRLASYRGPPPESPVHLPRLEIIEAYRARDGLVLGHHFGNSFDVRILPDGRSAEDSLARYDATERALRDAGGVPNFFGPQRFGEVRPVTHLVGRALVLGDPAGAVDTYLTAIPAGSTPGRGDEARLHYREHRDPARALREMPPEYRFERTLLERLVRGQDAVRALRGLSRELRLLFVHAYQSYLFNRWMSRRQAAGISMIRPSAGDRIVRVGRDGTVRANEAVPVESDNREECADLVARGRAMIAGPLVGYDTPVNSDEIGRMIGDLLREEGVSAAGFRLPFAPEISSKGAWRAVTLPVPPIGRAMDGAGIRFRFSLPKGAYATILLREFLKNGASDA